MWVFGFVLIFFFKDVGEGKKTEPEVALTMSTEQKRKAHIQGPMR